MRSSEVYNKAYKVVWGCVTLDQLDMAHIYLDIALIRGYIDRTDYKLFYHGIRIKKRDIEPLEIRGWRKFAHGKSNLPIKNRV